MANAKTIFDKLNWITSNSGKCLNIDAIKQSSHQGWLNSAILGRGSSYKDFIFFGLKSRGGSDLTENSILASSKTKLSLINVN